jgi:hypothetical protein
MAHEQILLAGFATVMNTSTVVGIVVGFYLLLESIFRLGITLKSPEPAPSLPVWILFWATDRVSRFKKSH